MVECRGGPGLALQPGERDRVSGELLGQKLQRDAASELEILRLVDHPHPAAAQDLEHAIVADLPADQVGRARRLDRCRDRTSVATLLGRSPLDGRD